MPVSAIIMIFNYIFDLLFHKEVAKNLKSRETKIKNYVTHI